MSDPRPRDPSPTVKLTLIGSLYVSQAIPIGFFTVALPAILRSRGAALEQVGLLGAVALPFLLKFLWAPVVDRYGSRRIGHFRSWILPLQAASALTVVAIAALGLDTAFLPLALAGLVFMLLAATQDVATDGLAVRLLERDERGPGNGIQVGGYYLGHILGGGVMLVAFGRLGWTAAMLVMASCLALPLVPAWRFREPPFAGRHPDRPAAARGVDYAALGRFFRRPGIGRWIAVLLIYRAAEALAMTMFNPMLVDAGYSLESIGLLIGVASAGAALAGALAGGLVVRRLGRKPPLIGFALLQAAAIALFLLPASGHDGMAVVYAVATAVAFAGGMGTAALYTAMMDASHPATAATDFSLQQALCAFGPLLGAALSGLSAAAFGYRGHFLLTCLIALGAVALVAATRLPTAAPAPAVSEAETAAA